MKTTNPNILHAARRGPLVYLSLILMGLFTSSLFATDERLDKDFALGVSRIVPVSPVRVTLDVPAMTNVRVTVTFTGGSLREPVYIDVHQPSADSVGSTGPNGPLIASSGKIVPSGTFGFPTYALAPSFYGCPSTWRVVIRSAVGTRLIRCTGIVTFLYNRPGKQKIEARIGSVFVGDDSIDKAILSRDGGPIAGTGSFAIKAKWHVEGPLGTYVPVTVHLIRPDGTTARKDTGYSQHSPNEERYSPKLAFNYTVSAADALLIGSWKIRVTNDSAYRVVNFNLWNANDGDIFDPVQPNFSSTFFAGCSGAFELAPEEQTAEVHEPLNYAFQWTVPDPLNWHDLRWLQLRIREGDKIVMWLKFDEATQTFSLLNEATGRFGKGFAAGSRNRLQTNEATLYLADTSVVADGPTSPTVTLNLLLSLKPKAAERSFIVEVAAQDDTTEPSEFSDFLSEAGTIVVPAK